MKNRRLLFVTTALLLTSTFALSACKKKESKAEIQKATTELKTMIDKENSAITQARALLDNKQEFIKKDLKQEEIDKVKKLKLAVKSQKIKNKDIEKLAKEAKSKEKELDSLVEKSQEMFDTQKKVNGWFVEAALNGSELKNDVAIKKDLREADLKLKISESNKIFNEKIKEVQKNAKNQLDDIKAANEAVDKAIKSKKKEDVDSAQSEIDKIKNADVRNELLNKLNDVRKSLNIAIIAPKTENKSVTENNNISSNASTQASSNVSSSNNVSNNNSVNNNGDNSSGSTAPQPPASNNSSGSDDKGEYTPPTEQPQPAPEKPQQVEKWSVWFVGDSNESQAYNIAKGTHVFTTEAEATEWIDNYADSMITNATGVSGSWGVYSFWV